MYEKHEIEDSLPLIYEESWEGSSLGRLSKSRECSGSRKCDFSGNSAVRTLLHFELTRNLLGHRVALPDDGPTAGALRRNWKRPSTRKFL